MSLRIAPDLALPVDVVTQPIAILARRGAGKTYTASVLVEEVIGAKVPVVILDPTGAWWGLRSAYECEVVPTPEEADVYTAARWPFVAPEARA